jgi:hypothetical protein
MSRSTHANLTADQRAERRARRAPRRPVRRQGTLPAIIATSLDDLGLVYPTWNPEV